MAAPPGNQNAAKGRLWADAIKRAIARKHGGDLNHGLDTLAEKLVDAVSKGDLPAIKELGDRIDGKPAQSVTLAGEEDGAPIQVEGRIKLVRP